MYPEQLNKSMPKEIIVQKVKYFGGPFNIGLYKYKNKILEIARLGFFVIQRVFFDIIFYILKKLRLDLKNKYFSPSIILIGKKIK
jgi:hypothetical protein